MAKIVDISPSSVQRIWRAHGLQPHRVKQFKLSTDPQFVDKLRDIVGLYVDPPAHAAVLSVDEKSQIQALDRTQPGLPMKPGRAGTMTHDYKRHGTTTLFAALNVLDGTVIGRNMQRHRHQEFIRFLNAIEAQVPARKAIHAIVDNYATHKHPKVRQWLARHPRWTFHFTPTSASWLNAVEGFFAKLTQRRLKRGVFVSVVDLQETINRFVVEHNAEPKPFIWTADPDKIIHAVRRGHQVLDWSTSCLTAAQMTFAKPTTVVIPELPPEIRSAHRSGKRLRHVRLLGEARLHQEHHRIGLGDRILGTIVMHRQSGDDDHALTRCDPQAAARIDDHGVRRRRQGQRQGLLGAHAQG